jgi:transcriptional repressor NrdR
MEDKVIDSREGRAGDLIRRRRECLKCGRRYTTYERIDEIPYMVIKKDGRRERFDRQKILQGLLKSCEKRPVATAKLEALVDEVERFVHEAPERERQTSEIGELLMNRIKKLDKVAYVRFASVYLDFKDVKEFMSELKSLLKDRSKKYHSAITHIRHAKNLRFLRRISRKTGRRNAAGAGCARAKSTGPDESGPAA